MMKEIAITAILLSLLIGDLSLLAWPSIFAAQSSDRKPPKKEKFASSLKRLKWDPNKQAAVESEQDNQTVSRKIGPGDVIKVETNLVVSRIHRLAQDQKYSRRKRPSGVDCRRQTGF